MPRGDRYRQELNDLYRRFERGEITLEEYQNAEVDTYDEFLAREHLRDNDNHEIFIRLLHETKDLYAGIKDAYYCGTTTRGEYLRALKGDDGTGRYDKRLFELGLAVNRWPDQIWDSWLWKAYKVERAMLPESVIDPSDPTTCPPGMNEAARETMLQFFAAIDDFNQRFVPTLPNNLQLRSTDWIQSDEEREALSLPIPNVVVTGRERRDFEQWRTDP